MAQLAPGPRCFAIIMYADAAVAQFSGGIGDLANQIDHAGVSRAGGRAWRLSRYSEQMIGELARVGALDGPVTGIVDAGSEFIGK